MAGDPVFDLHVGGKMEVRSTVSLSGRDDLSMAYTPGVARVCEAIAADPAMTRHYTWVPNTVAVVTDGTAVLGLGDIGPAAAMPVMEGKAVLFKQFGGVDGVPICLATTDTEEIIETVARLAPSFGGINLEDISAPRCFEIEDRLKAMLDIPVFHDDQHGTAVVALAALTNALRLTGRNPESTRVVISGAGAAGVAVAKILLNFGIKDLAVTDRKGVLHSGSQRPDAGQARARGDDRRPDRPHRDARRRARRRRRLHRALRRHRARGGRRPDGAGGDHLRPGQPEPRGAPGRRAQVRADRGDRPLGLPQPDQQRAGVPRASSAAPSTCTPRAITEGMKLAAAEALAALVGDDLAEDMIIPSPFDPRVGPAVAAAVAEAARREGVARL